jgi:hypothetical protein
MSGGATIPMLYRIVRSNPPTVEDFTSPMMLGKLPQRRERQYPGEWAGLSTFDSFETARAMAQRYPVLGRWIATLRLDSQRIVARQTFGPGHYTVWGLPSALLDAVVVLQSVDAEQG